MKADVSYLIVETKCSLCGMIVYNRLECYMIRAVFITTATYFSEGKKINAVIDQSELNTQ